jgi:hypothetical protein
MERREMVTAAAAVVGERDTMRCRGKLGLYVNWSLRAWRGAKIL